MDKSRLHQHDYDLRLIRVSMKPCAYMFAGLALFAAPVSAADYDHTEKSPLYELHLRVPEAAMAIPALRDRIMALHKTDSDETRRDATEDKDSDPAFHPYYVDTVWRVTFENGAVISLSGDTNADTGGAHPNEGFQTLVWDKKAGRALAVSDLFVPGEARLALAAVADAATKSWNRIYLRRSGEQPGPNADQARDGIGPEAEKLKNWALTYVKGEARANGIVLLYGAGQVWPHVLGDFRVPVPAAAFSRYLSAKWQPIFASK